MHLFVSNRSFTLRSTLGHSVTFERGKPTHVPKALHPLAVERGLLPCDEKGTPLPEKSEEIVQESEAKSRVLLAPDDPAEREDRIVAVFKALVAENKSSNFAGGGTPSAEAVSGALGWKTDQKEVRKVWEKTRAQILTGKKPE